MAYNNRESSSINEEQVAAFLADAVRRVESSSDSDIEALKTFKKLFKKNVPFSRRGYVAALLIKNASGFRSNRFNRDNNKKDRFANNKHEDRFNRNERTTERKTEEHTEKAPRVTIAPEAAGTIFIGVGRSRGVFPRDLVGLLVSVAGFDRSRIGEIRVLSNYSFIQLFAEDCDKAISALDGYEYRGRKLSVSYSRKKEEGENTADAQDEVIPANVSNEGHADTSVNTEAAKIAAEQSAFAASMDNAPAEEPKAAPAPVEEKTYFETTEDGQVKSHFVNN
ncbi:DbpA RNA binding domain-containing protein [Treponema sp.]|uniref:DbpA RNA binding domain-containing protein n=1 Tax=Treponema sp. TaxID=166 RepID=UPI001DAC87D5|nr:DbpA RNA binding domain-containing protein [Treponema sp.]MBS7241277.1 DbpA RNA binding domain-containing protein [Treponema sp.]MCI6442099.1 DbpA RNA binding domain-containing protein [Spirochaetia bacterium]MDY4132635.1 DbpA RNA binding domain-containing protein [Treponema sp.]